MEGQKELLGMWLSETEVAKFWLAVLTELQNRGVKDNRNWRQALNRFRIMSEDRLTEYM